MLTWGTGVHVHGCVPFLREGPLGCPPACPPPLPTCQDSSPGPRCGRDPGELGLDVTCSPVSPAALTPDLENLCQGADIRCAFVSSEA